MKNSPHIAEAAGEIVVRPPLPPPDMRTSVTFGLGEIRRLFSPTDADAWLVAPADLPRLSTAVIDRVIASRAGFQPAVESEPLAGWKPALQQTALVPVAHGRRGHPVLFPWSWTERMKQLAADQG